MPPTPLQKGPPPRRADRPRAGRQLHLEEDAVARVVLHLRLVLVAAARAQGSAGTRKRFAVSLRLRGVEGELNRGCAPSPPARLQPVDKSCHQQSIVDGSDLGADVTKRW